MPGRNDPCPCGSGRKYKRCCASRDEQDASRRRLLGDVLPLDTATTPTSRPGENAAWDVELVPLATSIESEPTARPAAALIVADELVIHADIITHPPAEPDEIGALLGDAVLATAERLGFAPTVVRVRHESVAAGLRERLATLSADVRHEPLLPSVEAASESLRGSMQQMEGPLPAICSPDTWAAWGLPEERVRKIFAAAAFFYEAKPWEVFADDEPLELEFPNGARWYATVLGGAGEQFGLVLHESMEDLTCILEGGPPEAVFASLESIVLSLSFDARGDLPKPMRREIAAAKWPVAGPSAHPSLWTLNTPGGGLTRAQAAELALALETVARYVAAIDVAEADATPAPEVWKDERTDVVVRSLGSFFDDDALWEPPTRLEPSLPEGRGADMSRVVDPDEYPEVFEERERAIVQGFAEWLRESGAPDARAKRDIENADALVMGLVSHQGVGLAAMTEYDLRVFLYDLYPRKFRTSRTTAMAMRGSLRRFFEFLAEREGIEYPWAEEILRDKDAFEIRWDSFPGGFWWDPGVREWQADLYEDLHARVLASPPMVADDGAQHGTMGGKEHRLWLELRREWLRWRDEVIRSGVTDPAAVLEALIARQRAWEREPRETLGGRSARSVVTKEREERGDVEMPFG